MSNNQGKSPCTEGFNEAAAKVPRKIFIPGIRAKRNRQRCGFNEAAAKVPRKNWGTRVAILLVGDCLCFNEAAAKVPRKNLESLELSGYRNS